MRNKFMKILVFCLVLVLVFGTFGSSAYETYNTYTYSIDGKALESPTAFSANAPIDSYGLGIEQYNIENGVSGSEQVNTTDMVTDCDGNIYISQVIGEKDYKSRILILNKYYKLVKVIETYVDEYKNEVRLSSPSGMYISDENKSVDRQRLLYVCDSKTKNIVVFDALNGYEYVRTIAPPTSKLVNVDRYIPQAVAVDIYGRIFVVSGGTYEGVVVLSGAGEFTGYIGAQKTSKSVMDAIWDMFRTAEQRDAQAKRLTNPYTNIAVDDDGFVYVVAKNISDKSKQLSNMRAKAASYSPVQKLNSTGVEIMKRNGFFDPSGEVDVFYPKSVSVISDIALGPEGTWTIIDVAEGYTNTGVSYIKSRFFTYDAGGNLLFAFGDGSQAEQAGNCKNPVAICYQPVQNSDGETIYYLLCLDNKNGKLELNVYSPTEYYDTILAALKNQNEHNYSASIEFWENVKRQNNNFDLAYIGIGKALFNQGKYEEAYEILKSAYETSYASKAFAEIRKDIIGEWLVLLLVVVVALVVVFVKFLGYAKKVNKATAIKAGRKTYKEELLYAFHLVFHPFDGFWDLKHEKRGSVRAASTILGITVAAFIYNAVGQGYLFNPRGNVQNFFMPIILVIVPLSLWVVSNWCLTTLFEGEGSLKDIYIYTCYSLAPLPLFIFVSTFMTNFMTVTDASMITLISTIGYIWAGFLLFFGTMVTHDYPMGKNIITILGTVVAMLVIAFVILLFGNLVAKMITFVISIFKEVSTRL